MANLFSLFSTKDKSGGPDYLEFIINERASRLHVADMAIEKAITLIANVVSKSDFNVFRYNEKTKEVEQRVDALDYTLNIKPNHNQTGSEFWRSVIRTLILEQKALIVQIDYKWYLADTYQTSSDVLRAKTYSSVCIDTLTLNKTFTANIDAIELTYDNKRTMELIGTFNKEFGDLLAVCSKSYKRNNRLKMRMMIPASTALMGGGGKALTTDDYAKEIEKKLTSDDDEVLKVGNNIEFSNALDPKNGGSVKDSMDTAKYIYEQVAIAFHIPVPVLYGTTTEKSDAVNDLITFAVSPIFEMLQDALTEGLLGENKYIKGERIRIDTSKVKHVDIYEVAQSCDKLFSIGFTHNEVRNIFGWPPVYSEWANTRHVTKNYVSEIELKEQNATSKGGN